jgi:hypothetical protein
MLSSKNEGSLAAALALFGAAFVADLRTGGDRRAATGDQRCCGGRGRDAVACLDRLTKPRERSGDRVPIFM